MAGDWIKMRNNLDTDPRVIEISELLGISELHVVGCLWKVWAWADQHTLDGNAVRVTCVTLDRFTCVTGFADALRKVGWLDGRDSSLSFPRFAEHNGQTAKKRAETKERVAKHRNANCVTHVTQKVLPEKRREEKRREDSKKQKHQFFENEEFSNLFDSFKSSSSKNHNWFPGEEVFDSWLYDLTRFSIDEAKQILRFSTSAGAKKPILNGDHKRSGTKDNENSRRGGRVSFDEGILT